MFKRYCVAAAFMVSIGLTAALSEQAHAQDTATAIPPGVSCATATAAGSTEDADFVNRYRSNPDAIIGDTTQGGLSLSNVVRALALADSGNMQTIGDALKKADDTQKTAIGAGLARAAFACGETKQQAQVDYADKIAVFVAQSTDSVLISAYQKSSQDVRVAAVSAPAGGSYAGGGDVTGSASQTGGQNDYLGADSPIDTTTGTYTIDGVNPLGGRDTISPG